MQKALLILAVLFVAGFASKSLIEEINPLWQIWKNRYQKTYSEEEEVERFAIFAHNYAKIMKYNSENDSARLALNKFADLTNEEFKAMNSGCAFTETDQEIIRQNTLAPAEVGDLPATVDWRNHGAVTPIKNQGQCGSCWSFSTTGVLEGFHFIKSGKLISFSEQQIVDCDTDTNQGCDGGYPYLAVQYAAKNGLETEADYPYTAQDGTCTYDKSKTTSVCGGYKFVTADSTDQLKSALVNQPVSVLIEADQDAFQFYSSGVLKTGCGASLDHAVLAVGYTKVGVLEAFIVKNSWGTDWGEQGYVYIWDQASVNGGKGVCGILSQPMIPTQ
jgi:KDEL-tailed cysteine endopeptidase